MKSLAGPLGVVLKSSASHMLNDLISLTLQIALKFKFSTTVTSVKIG